MKISVFGLGYTGCVSAACFARVGHEVTGVDISFSKVAMINNGRSPIVEKELDTIIAEQVAREKLRATQNAGEAINASDVIVVCVGTPDNGRGGIDYKQVERVCMDIGTALSELDRYVTIMLRSTIFPGFVESLAIPTLEFHSHKKVGVDFGFAVNPEFLREGSGVYDFFHPAKTVAAVSDERARAMVEELYSPLTGNINFTGFKEASFIKYIDNSFHAVKVSFANEIGRLCKILGVDTHSVMQLFLQDRKLNLSAAYLTPGFAFGGSCLPKDLRIATHNGLGKGLHLPLMEAALTSNRNHIDFAHELIIKTGAKRIGFWGFSFKSYTDDLRESPHVILIQKLIAAGLTVKIYDSQLDTKRLMGSNKEYILNMLPGFENMWTAKPEQLMENSDLLVLGSISREEAQSIPELNINVLDLTGVLNNGPNKGDGYEGLCW